MENTAESDCGEISEWLAHAKIETARDLERLVVASWVGKLTLEGESEVMAHMRM
jgi:hypothetical protein